MYSHRKVSASSGQTTAPLFPESVNFSAGIRLAPAGSGKLQYTLSYPTEVADNSAEWKDAAVGEVTADTDIHITAPVTAIRGVSTTGAITIELVGVGP